MNARSIFLSMHAAMVSAKILHFPPVHTSGDKTGRGSARAVSLILLLLCRCGLKDVVNYSVGKKSLAEQQYEDLLAVGNIVLQLACKSHTGSRGAQEQVEQSLLPSCLVLHLCN